MPPEPEPEDSPDGSGADTAGVYQTRRGADESAQDPPRRQTLETPPPARPSSDRRAPALASSASLRPGSSVAGGSDSSGEAPSSASGRDTRGAARRSRGGTGGGSTPVSMRSVPQRRHWPHRQLNGPGRL